ncbi:MAG TPA: metallophosphoesterase [Phnomibacter sp.]|nr:metallophosphoesterase [Phnomibacter sp.]
MEEYSNAIDGPYVLYRNDSMIVHYIDSSEGAGPILRTLPYKASHRENVVLKIRTDEPGKFFEVKLKKKLTNEKANFSKPKVMLALSDIEGDFAAFRHLLQGNGVIDSNFNWTFGKGHLVLIGDFVDRGSMVTELLWLIYSLEDKAEAAGGKVHYIMGNHEIMNMNGELDYVHPRYMQHAAMMQVPYINLFGNETELGRWMGTKNVAEQIGDILFTHGGMSAYINIMELPLKSMNDSVRKYRTDTSFNYPSPHAQILFSDLGPFWYRGYYMGNPKASMAQVDSTLKLYETSYITTGHTIVANRIATLYDGKVINTDLQHAKGISEALLVEGNKMFRVNIKGEKLPLEPLAPASSVTPIKN